MTHRRAVPPPDLRPTGEVRRPQFIGSFPYAGTSGFAAGSETSEARAREDDASGRTAVRQQAILASLRRAGARGATWAELAADLGWHHGVVSGALSGLHRTERVARLAEKRDRCAVYVLPDLTVGRETQPYGRPR